MTMQPRDYRETGAALADNLKAYLESHPDAFDCLLFTAIDGVGEIVVPGEDVVGSLERNERAVTYSDPVPARALKVPDGIPVVVTDDAGEAEGYLDAPIVLILNVAEVPKQSVIQYAEYSDDSTVRTVNVYVVRSESMSSIPGASGLLKHYCIPFRAFDDVEGNRP